MSGAESPWTPERGEILLRIARESLSEALGLSPGPGEYDGPWLREPGATFVTLRQWGKLRGCMGSLQASRPLLDDVWRNARAAAFRDGRFSPVLRQELPGDRRRGLPAHAAGAAPLRERGGGAAAPAPRGGRRHLRVRRVP